MSQPDVAGMLSFFELVGRIFDFLHLKFFFIDSKKSFELLISSDTLLEFRPESSQL